MNRISFRIFSVLLLAAATTLSVYGQATAAPANLSKDQLSTLVSTAKTPAEHKRIAQYYQAKAQVYMAQAQAHQAMLAAYKANPALVNNKNQASTVGHCEYLVQSLQQQAAKAQQQAQSHQLMAEALQPATPQQMASMQIAASQLPAQSMAGMGMTGAKTPDGTQPATKPEGMKCMMMDKMGAGTPDGMAGMSDMKEQKPAGSQPADKPQGMQGMEGMSGQKTAETKPPCCCDGMK